MNKCPDCENEMVVQATLAHDILGIYDRCWCETCQTVWEVFDTPSERQSVELALSAESLSANEDLFTLNWSSNG